MQSTVIQMGLVSLLFYASAFAIPPTPLPDPSGIDKNRYISMSIPDTGGNPVAIRVKRPTLADEYRWVGPPQTFTENDNNPTTFVAAQLQCDPYYADFASFGLFHAYGDVIYPNATFEAVVFDASCNGNEGACTEISSALEILTALCGDVAPPYQPPPPPQDWLPNNGDYLAVVNKIDRKPGSLGKVQLQLQPSVTGPSRTVNIMDANLVFETFEGLGCPGVAATSCNGQQRTIPGSLTQMNGMGAGPHNDVRDEAKSVKISITPVPAQGASSYPSGTFILGQELHAKTGGFRAYFNVQISDWDPTQATIFIRGGQVQVDAGGFLSANADPSGVGGDLRLADIPCLGTCVGGPDNGASCTPSSSQCRRTCAGGTNSGNPCVHNLDCPSGTCAGTCADPCPTLFGGAGSKCGNYLTGKCNPIAVDTTRSDYLYGFAPGLSTPFDSPLSPNGPIIGALAVPVEEALDDGQKHYLGTFALDIPGNALGRYTIGVVPSETIVLYIYSDESNFYLPDQMVVDAIPAVVDIGGVAGAKSRYLSIGAPDRGEAYAIRVKLTSLMHPDPPNLPQFPAPDFSAYEGQYRWVGSVSTHCETIGGTPPCLFPTDATYFVSNTQCSPLYADFHADTSGGVLHIRGADIIPSSIYNVDIVPLSCQGIKATCSEIVSYATVRTGRAGDTAPPFQLPSPASLTQPDISDIAAELDKFKTLVGLGEITAFVDVYPRIPTGVVNISDVSTCIDAFKNLPYVLGPPTNCP